MILFRSRCRMQMEQNWEYVHSKKKINSEMLSLHNR